MNKGDKVHTIKTKFEKPQNGIIKRVDNVGSVDNIRSLEPMIYVVFNCDGDWENYEKYSAVLTPQKFLRTGWQEETIPHPINDIL